jgi:hypothetical protein
MITFDSITPNTFKVVIQSDDMTDDDRDKLLRERDKTPAEFVTRLIRLLDEQNMRFLTYDHLNMIVTVDLNEA